MQTISILLDDEEMMLTYLQDAMQQGDKEFIKALETVARAKGITELARHSGLSRESLYTPQRRD